jgi:Tol biopolymer transport system component
MIGTRLGSYEVTGKLGEGGMGEVYRARDSRLDRNVAIKVLPTAFTADPDRLARFEREARLLAQLHHPNIASVFGLEDSSGVRALVMELVEGDDLSALVARGPVPVDEALPIARQLAEALEAAHEQGIVHRDLKPANVKVRADGTVKVLDFGLAKAMDPVGISGADAMSSPTLTGRATQLGVILGTAAYMSPEQATGGAVDRRADVWSFGVVLYEMLTGRRLFEGESVSHVLAGVLRDTPDFSALPATTPDRIVDLVRRCLRRKPRERLQAIGDARVVLEEVLADPHAGDRPATPSPIVAPAAGRGPRLAWIAAAGGLAAAGLFAALWLTAGRGAPSARPVHASLVVPDGTSFGDTFALSPDGRRLAFEAWDRKSGTRALWLRELDSGKVELLEKTEGGEMPFWSPDGTQLGFFAEGKMKRLGPGGGSVRDVCDAPTPRGGAWGPDGRIVFSASFRVGLSIVPAAGGSPKTLTTLDASRGEKSHRFPVFLPDGTAVLFLAQTAEGGARNDESAIELLDLATGTRNRLIATNSSPLLAPGGQILFWREGTLFAQAFDTGRRALAGEPEPIAAPVSFTQNEQVLAAVSGDGTLVYREGHQGTHSQLIWVDRKGLGMSLIREREIVTGFALSHDGSRVAVSGHGVGQGSTELWVQDLVRGAASRLTFEEGSETSPAWSGDDRFVYYANDRRNDGVIFRRSADGTGSPEEIGTTDQGIWPMAASTDGRWLVVGGVGSGSGRDLFRFDLGTKKLESLVTTPFHETDAALSPDDRLLAYACEESGRWEVYVQALGGERGRWQISTERGRRPRWRADGRELFFLAHPDRMMVVDVEPGEVPRFSAPRELFRFPADSFDVSPDGQRFAVSSFTDGGVDRPLTIVTGWTQRMTRR